ncbi:MAG TPA: hypothetical protein VEY07_05975 [Thermoplasmata archaeon]|nr:hypothetical protein [Thermoplasmata archaeon]
MSGRFRGRRRGAFLLPALLLIVALAVPGLAAAGSPPTAAASTYPPLTTQLTGPTTVGTLLSENYTVTVSGGPATALNGTVVGSYTYATSFTALNRTGIIWGTAPQGVILNGSITLRLTAGNATEPVTLAVLVTSTYQGKNVTQNATLLINIVQPYVLTTTLDVGSGAGVSRFYLVIELDGSAVGQVLIPTLTAGTSYPVSFRYVNTGLAPGWHTFSMTLTNLHGLVAFPGGAQSFTQSFYVAGPPPDNTLWYVTGAVAFIGAIVIWSARVGARRRGKGKK